MNTLNVTRLWRFKDKQNGQSRFSLGILSILLFLGLTSCTKGAEDITPDKQNTSIEIIFEADVNAVDENSEIFQQLDLRQLKFYLHDVQLFDDIGNNLGASLANKPPWQTEKGVLIKLDAQGEQRNNKAVLKLPGVSKNANIAVVRFTLGLGFNENHQDPLQAQTPFNVSSMYWSWQLGYKFLRLDFSRQQQHFNFHLGSTGCVSPAPVRPPKETCARPNLANITLNGFNPTRHAIQFRLKPILETLQSDTPSTHCTGNYQDNRVCSAFIQQIGLSAEQGHCLNQCQSQTLFTVIENTQ